MTSDAVPYSLPLQLLSALECFHGNGLNYHSLNSDTVLLWTLDPISIKLSDSGITPTPHSCEVGHQSIPKKKNSFCFQPTSLYLFQLHIPYSLIPKPQPRFKPFLFHTHLVPFHTHLVPVPYTSCPRSIHILFLPYTSCSIPYTSCPRSIHILFHSIHILSPFHTHLVPIPYTSCSIPYSCVLTWTRSQTPQNSGQWHAE